jgi:DNA modification methylase
LIICGDALAELRKLPDESVQTCITSPPYYGLRQYLFDKAVVLRYDLSEKEREYVEKEIERLKIIPRM